MRLYRALTDTGQRIAVTLFILITATLLTAFAIEHARLRMAEIAARERVCRAELAALRARNTFAERYLCPADPCLCVQVVAR